MDLDNDGKAHEVLPQFGDAKTPLTWYEAKGGKFVKHVVSDKSYGHGIGAGDVNGDGRNDILTPKGWFEAPADPRTGDWKFHADWNEPQALGFHLRDGREWRRPERHRHVSRARLRHLLDGAGRWRKWTKHMIDDSWSQAHALTLVDLNGDGQGHPHRQALHGAQRQRSRRARTAGDLLVRVDQDARRQRAWNGCGTSSTTRTRTGAGMQIPVADLDGDGDLDFAVGGKSGVFLFENLSKGKTSKR